MFPRHFVIDGDGISALRFTHLNAVRTFLRQSVQRRKLFSAAGNYSLACSVQKAAAVRADVKPNFLEIPDKFAVRGQLAR